MNRSLLAGGAIGLVVLVAGVALVVKIRRLRHPVSNPLICCTAHQDMRAINSKNADFHAEARSGVNSLVVQFNPSKEASVTIQSAKPWNWSAYGSLTMQVTNPSATGQLFNVRLDDAAPNGVLEYFTGFAPANSTTKFIALVDKELENVGLQQFALNYQGMSGLVRTSSKVPDMSQIARLKLSLSNVAAPTTLIFDSVEMKPSISIEPLVDRFGQNRFVDWPGKVTDEKMLAENARREEAELSAPPGVATDAYGGWVGGPKMPAKGHYYTAKWGNKWLFVTPLGSPMFLMGINAMTLFDPTMVDGRKQLFQDLPTDSGPLSDQYWTASKAYGPVNKGASFNFYGANVERKYGPGYKAAWEKISVERMKSWGFNTLVNYVGVGQKLDKTPYVLWASTAGQFARVSSGSNHWGKMPDPFDPDFAASVQMTVERLALVGKDDPYCMGYAVDNELSWGSFGDEPERYALAHGALEGIADQSPAKRAFVDMLKGKYGDVSKLNGAWGTHFVSWTDLEKPVKLSASEATDLGGDMSAYTSEFAARYFSTVRDAVKKADPDRLYFGCRLAFAPPEVFQTSAQYADVVSINLYSSTPNPVRYGFLKSFSKPVMFSEMGSGATDRGAFGYGIYDAGTQKGRADAFRNFLNWSIDTPSVAGCAWFQYTDQPPTGRVLDGQNCGIGLVDITDQPYPDLVQVARSVTQGMYKRLLHGAH